MRTLNKDRLLAFNQVAICKNFHRAADNLFITQSALSQRIIKLEQEIETTLLIRGDKEVTLTTAGNILLGYVRDMLKMEEDVLERISGRQDTKSHGIIRIATYSSILRSAIIPALQELIAKCPDLQVEFFCREMRDLPAMLRSGEADFILLDYISDIPNLVKIQVAEETIVHIQHTDHQGQDQPFLDHDEKDMTTYHFFQQQAQPNVCLHRCFYDNIYGIIDGVKMQLGQAVVSHHLISDIPEIAIIEHPNQVTNPVVIYYLEGQYLSHLQQKVLKSIVSNTQHFLNKSSVCADL
ncbi:LysR family transcriptional regulator [Aliiglaciecola sp. LCG003]|uniref:LysR family transcriptional regulator n=1 Tax=Aliiglaciecola sp. LCG003 TaxID=3053655 RepID=UPI002572329F|nr:LysR family transcriptional regulator [Aliiglaciecola sp. LCG003]WJG10771.1 LysR family transcriptional regulator [Aliiglaciecola sp. LCG003]